MLQLTHWKMLTKRNWLTRRIEKIFKSTFCFSSLPVAIFSINERLRHHIDIPCLLFAIYSKAFTWSGADKCASILNDPLEIWFFRLKDTFVKHRDMLLPSEATKHSEQKEAATCLQAYCITALEYGDINICHQNFLEERLSSLLLRTVLCWDARSAIPDMSFAKVPKHGCSGRFRSGPRKYFWGLLFRGFCVVCVGLSVR